MDNINLDGGHLSLEQLNAIFRTIPQEMDVLDENDRIVWSSMNKNRLFKRTKKDIDKTVFEVHPGHSQRHVKEVLNQMHAGNRKNISIMITKDEQPINISFYSLHNEDGKYIGCIEVTQAVKNLQVKGSKLRNILNVLKKH
ncbi:PAS domain-containing protein [Lactobacillus paragasseri]|uniref:PAS domain-containing protein n=1 Tax=Lactobacillus paragasseri TaxID=2107999 RepID=A0ABD5A1I8_9LACO|nr:PAS domain-containing protein [Lactobacillus paragasseri]MDK7953019.1 PAS domain-containing protein [Lactobacillus paragasseri]MDO6361656.1 PAS domain-containing protein [Lactobacillus paragasseri]MDX5059987.1 PAS domain-containing protein [Lactobacillus paragasseri]